MSRRRTRKYRFEEETGIVILTRRGHQLDLGWDGGVPASDASGPSAGDIWQDHTLPATYWRVDFNIQPATVTSVVPPTNSIDGWELNDGYVIYVSDQQLRVDNNSSAKTARFTSVPTSVTLALAVNVATGELLHGS